MRLIDADATIELLRSLGSRDYRREKGTIADAMKMLSHSAYTPTIEAEPVRHGRWEECQVPHILWCSECDWGTGAFVKLNYCPNCGAKMDLED